MATEVGKLYVQFDADGRPYIQGLKDIDRRTQQFGSGLQSSLTRYGKMAGLGLVAGLGVATAAVTALTVQSTKLAMNYDQSLTNAISVTGKFGDEAKDAYKQADKLAAQLGKDTAFSAKECADAMYDLASKGYDVSKWAATLPGIVNLASATQADLASTTELVTSTINQFNLSQEESVRVADVYTKAIGSSAATQEKLALSMRYIGPVAASMNWSLEQTTAVLGKLYDAGFQGEQAGTALRGAVTRLIDPSAEAAEALARLQVSTELLQSEGIEGVVGAMVEAGATTEDFAQVFSTEAAPAMLALQKYTGQAEGSVDDLEKSLKDAGGTAEKVAKQQLDTAAGQSKLLASSLEGVQLAVGKLFIPAVKDAAAALIDPINKVTEFIQGLGKIAGWEGADITGKLKIAWDELERQFKEWFEGTGNAEYDIHAVIGGVSGEQKLSQMFESAGEAAGQFLLGVIGKEADAGDSVWMRAGKAIWGGFWEGLDSYLVEGVKGFFEADTVGEGIESTGGLWEANPVATLLGERGVFQQLGARIGAWIVEGLQGPESRGDMEEGGEASGDAIGGAMVVPLTTRITSAILSALGVDTAETSRTTGAEAGAAFESGFLFALSDINTLIQEKFDIKAAAYSKGKATAGGLGLELGSSMGDTSGMKPQTIALLGRLGAMFPINMISGYRANDQFKDHPSGTAFDITWPGMGEGMGDAIARAAIAMGARYVIWDRETWWPGGGRTPYSYSSQDPHRDHIHVRTYHQGGEIGGPPGSEVLIHAQAGERVLSQEQNELFKTFVREIGRLADLTRDGLEEQQDFNEEFLAALSSRLDLLTGYVSRESARLSMQRAEFAPGGFDVSEMAAMVGTLTYQIEHLDMAVAEAEAQLNEAKWMKLPQEEVNRLAENLFNLRGEAADARRELEELERIPLEQALDRWANSADNLGRMMDILGEHSNAYELQSGLFPELLGYIGGSYQTNLDLMNTATLPSDIMGYGSAALSDLSSMYGAEQAQLQRALDGTLDSIDASEESWERAWQARADAVEEETDRQRDLLDQQLEDLSDAHRDQLDELNKFYDDKLRTLDDREREITRAEERNRSAKSVAGLEDELRILQGQGYYTEADIARMRQLETQIQEQRDAMVQQDEAWAREDERTRLQRERDEAVASLEQQQEMARIALEDQVEAARKALDAQREAMDREREQQRQHFEDLRRQAEAAHQAELDRVIEKYAALMQEVIDAQNEMLGEAGTYQNAGQALGQAFADGIMAAIPAIQAAAQAAAEAAAQYLELNSPADKGPLSTLDRWWEKFAPTLYEPLIAQDFMRPVMDTYGPAPTVSEEHIYLHTDPGANIDVETLCDLVSRKIGRRVEKAQWGA